MNKKQAITPRFSVGLMEAVAALACKNDLISRLQLAVKLRGTTSRDIND
jgi:hypothetical protein